MKPWYLYIATARTGRYYVGITNDVTKRIEKHNSGQGSKFAVEQGPFVLSYVSRSLNSKSEARKLEIKLKGWGREKKEKLISGAWELPVL